MRRKLVLTRCDVRAPKDEQVISAASSIALSEAVQALYKELELAPEKHEVYLQLADELRKQALYRQAIRTLSCYLVYHPFDANALCLRGRLRLAIQCFDEAAADMELSARLEPDDWSNLYHLALAQFIRGDFTRAAQVYRRCFELSADGGEQVAVASWYWATLTRLGKREEADALADSIPQDIDYGENYSYYKSIMFYKGVLSEEETLKVDEDDIPDITLSVNSFGVANWKLANGDAEGAYKLMKQAVEASEADKWSAFAYLAAQAELERAGQAGE